MFGYWQTAITTQKSKSDLKSEIQIVVGELQGTGCQVTIESHWDEILIEIHIDTAMNKLCQ